MTWLHHQSTSFVGFTVAPMVIPGGIMISTLYATVCEGNYDRVIIGRVPDEHLLFIARKGLSESTSILFAQLPQNMTGFTLQLAVQRLATIWGNKHPAGFRLPMNGVLNFQNLAGPPPPNRPIGQNA